MTTVDRHNEYALETFMTEQEIAELKREPLDEHGIGAELYLAALLVGAALIGFVWYVGWELGGLVIAGLS